MATKDPGLIRLLKDESNDELCPPSCLSHGLEAPNDKDLYLLHYNGPQSRAPGSDGSSSSGTARKLC